MRLYFSNAILLKQQLHFSGPALHRALTSCSWTK